MKRTWEIRIKEDLEYNFRRWDEDLDLMMIVCGIIWDESMMIMSRNAWESRCLVLGLLVGRSLIVCS